MKIARHQETFPNGQMTQHFRTIPPHQRNTWASISSSALFLAHVQLGPQTLLFMRRERYQSVFLPSLFHGMKGSNHLPLVIGRSRLLFDERLSCFPPRKKHGNTPIITGFRWRIPYNAECERISETRSHFTTQSITFPIKMKGTFRSQCNYFAWIYGRNWCCLFQRGAYLKSKVPTHHWVRFWYH